MRVAFPFSRHGSRRSSAGNDIGSRLQCLRLLQPYGQCGRPDIGRVGKLFFWDWEKGSLCRLRKTVLSCFLFCDQKMGVKAAVFCAIDISPGEMKNVVDTESSVQTDQDDSVIPEVGLFGKIVIFEIM